MESTTWTIIENVNSFVIVDDKYQIVKSEENGQVFYYGNTVNVSTSDIFIRPKK